MADPFVDKKMRLCLSDIELLSTLLSVTDSVQQLADEGTDLAGPNESTKARCDARIVTCKTVHHIISMAVTAHDTDEGRPAIISLDHDMVETLRLGLRLFFALDLLEDNAEDTTHSAFVALLDKTDRFSSCPDDFDTDDEEEPSLGLDLSCQPTNEVVSEEAPEPEFATVESSARPRSLQRSTSSLNLLSRSSPTASETPTLQDGDISRPLASLGMATGSRSTASGKESNPVTPPRLPRPLSAILEVDEVPSTPRHNYNMSASFAFQSPIFSYDKPSNLKSSAYNPNHFSLDDSDSSSLLDHHQPSPSSSREGSPNYTYLKRPTSSNGSLPSPTYGNASLFAEADAVSSPLTFGASTSTEASPLPFGSGNPTFARDRSSSSTGEPSSSTWTYSSPLAQNSSSPLQFRSSPTSSTISTGQSSQSEANSDRHLIQANTGSPSSKQSKKESKKALKAQKKEQKRQEKEEKAKARKEKEKIVIHDPAFAEYLRDNGYL